MIHLSKAVLSLLMLPVYVAAALTAYIGVSLFLAHLIDIAFLNGSDFDTFAWFWPLAVLVIVGSIAAIGTYLLNARDRDIRERRAREAVRP